MQSNILNVQYCSLTLNCTSNVIVWMCINVIVHVYNFSIPTYFPFLHPIDAECVGSDVFLYFVADAKKIWDLSAMDDDLYSRDQGALGPGPTENAYPGRLSGLRSSYSILPTKPHPGSAPIRGIRDGADTLDSVDSLLASRNSGQLSQNGVSEISSIDDIMVKTADRPQFAPNPLDHVSHKDSWDCNYL